MSEKQFKEIEGLLRDVLKCKNQAHRRLAIGMILNLLREMVGAKAEAVTDSAGGVG